MGVFGNLFGYDRREDAPELMSAIERSVSIVEPLLRQTGGYPKDFRKPVANALEYARSLAERIPGPVVVDRESYAKNALVHIMFPAIESVDDAICSSLALQDYLRRDPATDELYALMGMRRFEKSLAGMQLSGQMIQRDVVQKVVYFTSHTLENPALSEQQARELVASGFFDCLAGKVKKRIEARKQSKESQLVEKELLMARLRNASEQDKPALEEALANILESIQSTIGSLELSSYVEEFEVVMLNPEQHLYLDKKTITLDSMGIRRDGGNASRAEEFVFDELIGYDRRDWTVIMVLCKNMQIETFAERLDKAYRRLVF